MTHLTSKANDVAVVVRLPQDLREALRRRATEEDRSVASLLRRAARDYLDRPEDQG
jgi:predicted transcriptional regulator